MDVNLGILLSLVLRILAISGMAIFVLPQQVREVRRPVNEFTRLRWQLLILGSVVIASNIIPIFYLFLLTMHIQNASVQTASAISGNIGWLALSFMLIDVYRKAGK